MTDAWNFAAALLRDDLAGDFSLALRWLIGAAVGVIGLGCVVLTVIGLPGLWLLLLVAGILQLAGARGWLYGAGVPFDPWTLGIVAAAAIGAEVCEFVAGAAGAKKAGASRRGMVGATIGGIAGAILGAPFGLLPGAIIGGVLGSALGAIVMELTLPHRTLESTLKPAHGAAMGRLKGLAAKLLVTLAIWIALTIAAIVE